MIIKVKKMLTTLVPGTCLNKSRVILEKKKTR